MGRLIVAWLFTAGMSAASPGEAPMHRFEFTRVEMAVPFKIILYAKDSAAATGQAEAAFARIHALNAIMSDFDEQSELNRLCATAGQGKPAPVSDDLWKVLVRAEEVSAVSQGAFDVTVGPLVHLWRRARRRMELPSNEQLAAARTLVGYRLLRLDPKRQTVELLKSGMQLDLGGIAKGYAVDEALAVLRKGGTPRALVDAGGDLGLGDPPPDRPAWRIGLTPLDGVKPVEYLLLSNSAVSTSGDNVQYVEIGGRRYSHIVDPRTGRALTDHCRVTVVAANGMWADAISKAVGVLGPAKGLPLIDATPGAAALVLRAPGGQVERSQSRRWKDLPIECVVPAQP